MKTITYNDEESQCQYTIYIGENKQENWNMIDNAESNDLWFHVENLPSCHVILKCNEHKNKNKKPCRKLLKQCAYLCKIHTNSAKSLRKCTITYTRVECLEKTSHVGEVIARDCKWISV